MRYSQVKQSVLAAGYETGKIVIWDSSTGQKRAELPAAHTSACIGLAFSPLNNLLLCSCGSDGRIQFFDIVSLRNVKTIETG
jgi:WD40 repeat protein